MPRILVLAATTGYQTRSFAQAAASLGVKVSLATDRCHILENPWADSAIAVRFEELERSAELLAAAHRSDGIDALAAVADRPTVLAALTAERLGIRWHPVAATLRCLNKHEMRHRFGEEGLLVPRDALLTSHSTRAITNIGFPCVLKPLNLSGSRGVIRVDNDVEFDAAVRRIRAIVADEKASLQVEQYIPGREFALEGLMSEGELMTLAIFDKPDPLTGPYFEETVYVTPSREPAETQRGMIEATRRAVGALGLWHGPVHAEMRVNDAGVWMLEIAARPIGGLCSRALRFKAPEFDGPLTLEQIVVLHAIGRMPERLEPFTPAAGVMMIPVPGKGILAGVEGVKEAGEVTGIDDVTITAKRGEKLVPLPEGSSYTGFLFASGRDSTFVERALREAHRCLRFELLTGLQVVS